MKDLVHKKSPRRFLAGTFFISKQNLFLRSSTPATRPRTSGTAVAAVSYTHLDVYKRQGLHCAGFLEIAIRVGANAALVNGGLAVMGAAPAAFTRGG